MAAPKGNQFWKLRSKHGRDTLFADAAALWQAATEYFEWCDENPWNKKEAIKGGEMAGELISIPTQRPYTLSGLLLYCDAGEAFWRNFKASDPGKAEDFKSVITRIEEIITTQQFEGATVGAFNPTIIARKLGLTDKQQIEHSGQVGSITVTPEEAKAISDALKRDI